MDKKQYRLLKDIQSMDLLAKAGDVGVLNLNNVNTHPEGHKVWFDNGRYFYYENKVKENLGVWFEEVLPVSEPVKERIEVLKIEYLAESIIGNTHLDIKFSNGVTPGKFKLIKKAIEWVLENPETTLYDKSYVEELQKRLTQSEVDTIRKEAFEAGRKHDGTPKYGFVVWEYPIYEQYLSSLNLNTNDTDKGEKFKLGDVVIHKAGGLPMTCDGYKNETEVKCQWFDKASRKFGVFHESVLMPYTAPEQPTNGNAFIWTDELVMEIIGLVHRAGYYKEPAKVYDRIKSFKQSKQSVAPVSSFKEMCNSIADIANDQINKIKQSPPLSEIKEGNAPTTPAKPIVEETVSTNNDDVACLSLNDLLSVWGSGGNDNYNYKQEPLYKKFEKLAKQKLKQQ